MCYRRDLFEKAGLPTDREEVSALWPTWEDFIATGEQFQDGHRRRRRPLRRLGHQHLQLDPHAERRLHLLRHRRQPRHRAATRPSRRPGTPRSRCRRRASRAKLQSFSNEWNAGFKNGTFATVACPAWMTGYIEEQAGEENAGKWDIATVPGGGGNWGGSFLAVPTASEHQDLAIELAQFLTSADGQLAALRGGRQPAVQPDALRDPELKDKTNEYFSDAPVGADLRGRCQQPRAGLPRRQEPAGARRGRERTAQRRERRDVLRRRLGRRRSRTPQAAAG